MIQLKSSPLELRGVSNKQSKSGKVYYIVNAECEDGTPVALYCSNADAFKGALKKGDSVVITFKLTFYKGNERLDVLSVDKS